MICLAFSLYGFRLWNEHVSWFKRFVKCPQKWMVSLCCHPNNFNAFGFDIHLRMKRCMSVLVQHCLLLFHMQRCLVNALASRANYHPAKESTIFRQKFLQCTITIDTGGRDLKNLSCAQNIFISRAILSWKKEVKNEQLYQSTKPAAIISNWHENWNIKQLFVSILITMACICRVHFPF